MKRSYACRGAPQWSCKLAAMFIIRSILFEYSYSQQEKEIKVQRYAYFMVFYVPLLRYLQQ